MPLKVDPEHHRRIRQVGILTTIPFILVFGPLIGYFFGHWIDEKFGTDPYATSILIVLGFVSAGREVYRMIKEVQILDE